MLVLIILLTLDTTFLVIENFRMCTDLINQIGYRFNTKVNQAVVVKKKRRSYERGKGKPIHSRISFLDHINTEHSLCRATAVSNKEQQRMMLPPLVSNL